MPETPGTPVVWSDLTRNERDALVERTFFPSWPAEKWDDHLFTTKIAYAWLVVDEMRKLGFALLMSDSMICLDGQKEPGVTMFQETKRESPRQGTARTVDAEGICLAALRAVGVVA